MSVAINEALRAHVTSAKFVLTLSATQIAALVWIERQLRRNLTIKEELSALREQGREVSARYDLPARNHPMHRTFNLHVTGTHGLIARGLVTHTMPTRPDENRRPTDIWAITPAGRAVVTLLQEAGIWQEYVDALPAEIEPAPKPARAGRRRAA